MLLLGSVTIVTVEGAWTYWNISFMSRRMSMSQLTDCLFYSGTVFMFGRCMGLCHIKDMSKAAYLTFLVNPGDDYDLCIHGFNRNLLYIPPC